MNAYLSSLAATFTQHADPAIAAAQAAYLRNQFTHLGLKTPLRKELQKPFLQKDQLPPREQLSALVKTLWEKPEREYQYFAQELAFRYRRRLEEDDIQLFEYMITHKSWWDTVDLIAGKLVGDYFAMYPEQIEPYIQSWLTSGNIWLQRTALLFQLNYKQDTDTDLLARIIQALLGSNEFFINKAIGWILRQYSKVDPNWVRDFVKKTDLHPLSVREGMKYVK